MSAALGMLVGGFARGLCVAGMLGRELRDKRFRRIVTLAPEVL